jgi:glycosyltransferase involved in cell wall biosynthesis
MRGIRFFLWAARTIDQIIRQSGKPDLDWFITEVASCYSLLFLRCFYRSKANLIAHQVATNVSTWKERGWRSDPFMPKLTLREELHYGWRCFFAQAVSRIGVRAADGVMTNSQLNVDELELATKLSAVIPNSVSMPSKSEIVHCNASQFSGKAIAVRKTISSLNLILVARVEPLKGIALAFEAVRRLNSAGFAVRLQVIGSTPMPARKWLGRLMRKYEDISHLIIFCGSVDRDSLIKYYREADALFLPSFFEGSPRVVYEACAAGCAVVVSDLSGVRLVDPENKFLFMFKTGDVDAACNAIRDLATQQKDSKVKLARREMQRCFNANNTADRMVKFYSELKFRKIRGGGVRINRRM